MILVAFLPLHHNQEQKKNGIDILSMKMAFLRDDTPLVKDRE